MVSVTDRTEPEITSAFENETTPKKTTTSSFATGNLDVSKRRLRTVIIIILGISLLFQTIALAAPGWVIAWHGKKSPVPGLSSSAGVFYHVMCVTSEDIFSFDLNNEVRDITDEVNEVEAETVCRSRSYLDTYRSEAEDASDSKKLTMKREYNLGKARQQIGATIVWLNTLLTIATIVYATAKNKPMVHLGFVLGCVLAVSGIVMGELIYVGLVELDFLNGSKKLNKDLEVGFPYCVFFYILACIQVFASCILVFKCFHDDVTALKQRISEQNVVIGTDKKHIEYLRHKTHRDSPTHSRRPRDKLFRELRSSPRNSPRTSRELNPSPRASPRPSPRPSPLSGKDHQKFFTPSPRNSYELKDYDRHSSRPPREKNSDRPRDRSRHDGGSREQRKRRSRDNRGDNSRLSNQASSHDRSSPRPGSRLDVQRHPDDTRRQPTDNDENHHSYAMDKGKDYQPIPVSSESETLSDSHQGNTSDKSDEDDAYDTKRDAKAAENDVITLTVDV